MQAWAVHYCCLLTEALARFPRALVHGFQSVGSGRVLLRWRSFQVLPISLSHELIIFCGPRPGRRVGRQATGPLWDHIAQSSGELLVDGAARAQAAPHERNDKEDCKMAGADWHLRSVRNLKQLICTPGARDLLPTSRTAGLAARLLIKEIKIGVFRSVRYLNTTIQLFFPKVRPAVERIDDRFATGRWQQSRPSSRLTSSRASDAMLRR